MGFKLTSFALTSILIFSTVPNLDVFAAKAESNVSTTTTTTSTKVHVEFSDPTGPNVSAWQPAYELSKTQLEMTVSEFQPMGLRLSSRLNNATAFEATDFPKLNLGLTHQLMESFPINFTAGLSFQPLERTALDDFQNYKQQLYFFSMPIGVEILPHWKLAPFIRASAMPSVLMTHDSPLSLGTTEVGVPFQILAGITYEPKWLRSREDSYWPTGITASFEFAAGSAGEADILGIGGQIGLKFRI